MNTAPKLSSKKETKGMRRIEPEEAMYQWNKDGQGLIKEMKGIGLIDSMRRGHATPKYHNATFKVFSKASCVASLAFLCYAHITSFVTIFPICDFQFSNYIIKEQ